MKIVICASIDFTPKIKEIADILLREGHEVEIPFYSQKILNGEISLEEFLRTKQKNGDIAFRKKAGEDLIKRYFRLIKDSNAVLVVNIDKKGVKIKKYTIDPLFEFIDECLKFYINYHFY